MKLAFISYRNLKSDKYWNLILETEQDVQKYFEVSSDLSCDQFVDLWTALKQPFMDTTHFYNQRLHQGSVYLAGFKIEREAEKTGNVSLVDACNIHDSVLINRFESMMKMIKRGPIRMNSKGGMSFFNDFYQTHMEMPCDEKRLREYLLAPDDTKFELTISTPNIVIENDSELSDELYKVIKDFDSKQIQRLYNFKFLTDNWKPVEFFNLFNNGIKNGLHTIFVETTLYNIDQAKQLASVLKKVMLANPEKTLEIKLLLRDGHDMLNSLTMDLPNNLKLTLLCTQ